MSFRNRVIFLASIGFALGTLIGTVITAVSATMTYADGTLYLCTKEFNDYMKDPLLAFVAQAVVCGLYGMIGMGGSAVYSIEEWSLLKATVSHFLLTVCCYYITAFFCRWISPANIADCLFMLVLFVIPYLVIWLSSYLSYRSKIMEINRELIEMKAAMN